MHAKASDVRTKDCRITYRRDGVKEKVRDGDTLVYRGPSDLGLVFCAPYVFAGTTTDGEYAFFEHPAETPVTVSKDTVRDQFINGDWDREQ